MTTSSTLKPSTAWGTAIAKRCNTLRDVFSTLIRRPSRTDVAVVRERKVSPLTLRILAVNILALLILLSGILYLGRYKDQLVYNALESLQTEALLLARAVGEGAIRPDFGEKNVIMPDVARLMIHRLVEITGSRTRLFDKRGDLIADSHTLMGSGGLVQVEELAPMHTRDAMVSDALAYLNRVIQFLPGWSHLPLYQEKPMSVVDDFPEAAMALRGEASWASWQDEQGELILTAAVPVQHFKEVLGVILITHDGAAITETLQSVRTNILSVFAIVLTITVMLSLYLGRAIIQPLNELATAAGKVRTGQTRPEHRAEIPDFTARHDEIGDLSFALRDMTRTLWARMDAIERFAADVAHEIKNPLTSMKSAIETVMRVDDAERIKTLLHIVQDDVVRLDRLITDISRASRLDAELSRINPEPFNVVKALTTITEIRRVSLEDMRTRKGHAPQIDLALPEESLVVKGFEGRFVQVFENLLDNAASFSPENGHILVTAHADPDGCVVITVDDHGPGIPDAKLETVFERFYTERPSGEKFGSHSGLGLSISRQIIQSMNGRITAENRRDDDGDVVGARFMVMLPLSEEEVAGETGS